MVSTLTASAIWQSPFSNLPLLLLWPVLTVALLLLFGRRLGPTGLWYSSIGAMTITSLLSNALLVQWLLHLPATGAPLPIALDFGPWLDVGEIQIPIRFVIDGLSIGMGALIGVVAWLVQIFSMGYLANEVAVRRYNVLLHLFVGAMLVLVFSDALPLLFVGWEGVGICSALLVGFWYQEPKHIQAGGLAFVLNRIGDVGLMIAMMMLAAHGQLLPLTQLEQLVLGSTLPTWAVTAVGLALLWAACGKSAQLPLYLWLPAAMVGPTPISALMHAATMVTAGIYLLLRTGPLLLASATTQVAAAWVGSFTALLAALMATCQWDLKKILAFSTVSQLGLMLLGVGSGQLDGAFFHILTHAGGKAALFLAAGVILYHLHHIQDIRQMGALSHSLPRLRLPMVVAAASLAGVPLLGGFWSKDGLLAGLWAAADGPLGSWAYLLYGMGWLTSVLTAVYMMRLLAWLWWPSSKQLTAEHHGVAVPWSMLLPVWLLAGMAAVSGLLCLPTWLGGNAWLATVLGMATTQHHLAWPTEVALLLAALLATGIGGVLGWGLAHAPNPAIATWLQAAGPQRWQHYWREQAYYPKFLERVVLQPLQGLAKWGCGWLVEGALAMLEQFAAGLVRWLGFALQLFQNGQIQRYVAVWLVALACLLYGWLAPWHGAPTPEPSLGQGAVEQPRHDGSPVVSLPEGQG